VSLVQHSDIVRYFLVILSFYCANKTALHMPGWTFSEGVVSLNQWYSNVLARGPYLSFRNPSRATRINLNKNSLKWLKC